MPPTILPFPGVGSSDHDHAADQTLFGMEALLKEAKQIASKLGIQVCEGWLEVNESPFSFIAGSKKVTLSVTHTTRERLMHLVHALKGEPLLTTIAMSIGLKSLLNPRPAA